MGKNPIYFQCAAGDCLRMETRFRNGYHVQMERVCDDVRNVVRDSEEWLRSGMETMKQQARAAAEKTDQVMRERPYETLGIAFGLGLLVGVLAAGMLSGGGRDELECECS